MITVAEFRSRMPKLNAVTVFIIAFNPGTSYNICGMQARRAQDSQEGPEICGACFYLCFLRAHAAACLCTCSLLVCFLRGSRRSLPLYLFFTCVFFSGLTPDLLRPGVYRYKADHRSLIERQRRWG